MSEHKKNNSNPAENDADDPVDEFDIRPEMEPLSPEELERFLARVRAQGRTLTSEEQYAIFGPPPAAEEATPQYEDVEEMEAAHLAEDQLSALQVDFFPELSGGGPLPSPRLVRGIIFDFDNTLARLTQPLAELMEAGAKGAADYMRSTGMDLADDFWQNIIEARLFAQEKSEEEKEEHIADDAMSFLLQFFGYPVSQMDRDVLRRAVDIFYAPEMTAWEPAPHALDVLAALRDAGYTLAILANYNCDRVFQRTIDYLGFRPYLDVCITSASVEYRKPDERLFQLVLDRWDALPYETVVVGDSLVHDIQSGLDLGALTVHVAGPTTPQVAHDNAQVADQVQPDVVITDLAQLPAHVQQWAE